MPTITTKSGTRIYKSAPHGLPSTRKDELNADLLAFFKLGSQKAA